MTSKHTQAVVDVIETKSPQDVEKKTDAGCCSKICKPLLAELVSTALVLLFGCMSCMPILGLDELPALFPSIGFGMAVMFNIQIFGHISGAHMNPIVTLASVILGKTSITLGIAYIIVQCIGATIGYGILVGLAPIDIVSDGICATKPHHPDITQLQTLGIEIAMAVALILVVCSLWDPVNQHLMDSLPIKFGLSIVGITMAAGPLTGAGLNPARSIGPAMWTGIWTVHWIYWVGPLLGSAVTTICYKYIFLDRSHRHSLVLL